MEDLTIGGDDYPGEVAVTAAVEEACTGTAFRDYVGRGYRESELDVYYMYPIERGWERDDDREYACLAIADRRLAAHRIGRGQRTVTLVTCARSGV